MKREHGERGDDVINTNYCEDLVVNDDERWKDYLPIGFRFYPTTGEIFEYLNRKVSSQHIPKGIIHDFDVYECQPSDLPGFEKDDTENKFAYFFTPRDKMNLNPNAKNQKRTTRDNKGSWKATSKPTHHTQGKKNTLVYHLKSNGKFTKTNWIMHEFVLDDSKVLPDAQGRKVVLCRIYERNEESAKKENQQNVGVEEERRITIIDEVDVAEPSICSTSKIKERGDQPGPHMGRESSTNHHHYSNEVLPHAQNRDIVLYKKYERNEESTKKENQQNPSAKEEMRDDAAKPPVRSTFKGDQPGPHINRELSTDHRQYYNEPRLPQPKMARYSPTHYSESAIIGGSSHDYLMPSDPYGVPPSYPMHSDLYANQAPIFSTTTDTRSHYYVDRAGQYYANRAPIFSATTNTRSQCLFERSRDEDFYQSQSPSVRPRINSMHERGSLPNSAPNNNLGIQQQHYRTFGRY